MVRWFALAALLVGCKKEAEDTGPSGSCDDIETVAVSSVPAGDFPPGLTEQLTQWRDLPGVYTADYCGRGEITVKLDGMPAAEDLQLVTAGVDDRLLCGCSTDPDFPDADNALGAHAWSEGTVLLFDVDTEFEPSVVEQPINGTLVYVTWALLPPEAPFALRACANQVPIIDNAGVYQTADIAIRVSAGSITPVSGTVTLTGSDESLECALSSFVFFAENGA